MIKIICDEFAVKSNVWGTPEGNEVPLIDVIFTPIYELDCNGSTMYFNSFKTRKEAIELILSGNTAPNSTFEYIEGLKVYNKLIK